MGKITLDGPTRRTCLNWELWSQHEMKSINFTNFGMISTRGGNIPILMKRTKRKALIATNEGGKKNNRVKRSEGKKEEMKRLRKLVDNAYNSDTRIAKFMENDKQEKAAKKQAKQDAIRERKEAEEKVLRDAEEKIRKEKEEKEKIETERKAKEKVEEEALKKAMKNEKKIIKNRCKDTDYYSTDPDEKVQNLTDLDRLCEILNLDELKMLN